MCIRDRRYAPRGLSEFLGLGDTAPSNLLGSSNQLWIGNDGRVSVVVNLPGSGVNYHSFFSEFPG